MRSVAGTIGGVLIIGGCVPLVAAIATGATGPAGPDGTPLRDAGRLLLNAALALLGSGAAVLGLAGPRPLDGRPVRVGLVVLAVGLVSLMACILTPIPAGSNSLASAPYVLFGGIGFLAIAIGTLVMVVSLVRAPGETRFVGALFVVGLLMAIGFRLLANGVIALGPLQPVVEFLAALGGGAMLVAVAGLGMLAIRGGRSVAETSA
jgi:hypothetical protein